VPPARASATPVYVEVGKRRAFASARDWPGWCRAGKGEEEALRALAEYVPRYAVVAAEAGLTFRSSAGEALEVVERLPGDATTEFGAPSAIAAGDADELSKAEAGRHAALLAAAWAVMDRVVAGAPATLRKGPRGGGRDRDAIADHVLGAEAAYARKIGIAHKPPAAGDTEAVAALRGEILDAFRTRRFGEPPRSKGWPPRYAARRIAWHVLDHAWEIEDKS
jgi:hypothetical protein